MASAGSQTLNLRIKRLRGGSVRDCQGVSESVCVKVSVKVSKVTFSGPAIAGVSQV